MLEGAAICRSCASQLGLLAGWGLLSFGVALRIFRWR